MPLPCKHCRKEILVSDFDSYVKDNRTNDIFCSNSHMLEFNKKVKIKSSSVKKFKISWKCPNCDNKTSCLPFSKKCDCGHRFVQVKDKL